MNETKETIENLRKNLSTLRIIAGWSAEQLATILDVSRATIVSLENTENKMSVMQFYAIMYVLKEKSRDNKILEKAMCILLERDNVSEKMKQDLRDRAASTAKRVGRKSGASTISKAIQEDFKNMKISEIDPNDILNGQIIVDELITRKTN